MGVVTVTITSDGKTMDPAFELVMVDIVKEVNRIPYATLSLRDGSVSEQTFAVSDEAFFEPGREIDIKLRYEDVAGSESRVFKGLVVKQIVEANEQGTLLTVALKDAALKMTQCRHSIVYAGKTDAQVFETLIADNGLKKGVLEATKPAHAELVQYHCTDWDFMLSRADFYGLLVIANDGYISVKKIKTSGILVHTITFGISEIYGFEMEVDGSHQYKNIESIAWDRDNQKLTQASKAASFSLPQGDLNAETIAHAVGGDVQSLASAVPLDPETLQSWADGAMIKSRLSMIRGRISVPGTGSIRRMDLINVSGVGKRFNGKTLVTGVRHRVDRNGWQTDVQFGLSAERFISKADIMDRPAAGHLPGVNGLQIGIVTDNQDPDKKGRVKVMLPGIDEKKGEVWARLASPDAGNGRGFFFRPEKGDEVIVGFFNDDPRQAVILGAMYNAKNTPPREITKDNINKGIFTIKGSSLAFIDDKKPSVIICTAEKNGIIFDDDGELVEIQDQHGNKITMNKDGVTIKSAKDFKIDASGNVEINGTKVDVK